jgi:predicted GNAT superfamily acetyltransferase
VPYTIRRLTTLEECFRVVALEKEVWGYTDYEDVVPAAILLISVKRGGVLLGAFDERERMVGFAYALAALKDGEPSQWSHMLGVLPEARDAGLGAELKREQRRIALQMGIALIEWTYDPMQALNAHLNFAKLGVVAEEYLENIYGDSSSPLHHGNPTDRLVALWKLDAPHVVRRMERSGVPMRDVGAFDAPAVLRITGSTDRPEPGPVDTTVTSRRLSLEIPVGFSDMLLKDAPRALAWRLATREAFKAYMSRGYRVVDFFLEREKNRGRYLLAIPS